MFETRRDYSHMIIKSDSSEKLVRDDVSAQISVPENILDKRNTSHLQVSRKTFKQVKQKRNRKATLIKDNSNHKKARIKSRKPPHKPPKGNIIERTDRQ